MTLDLALSLPNGLYHHFFILFVTVLASNQHSYSDLCYRYDHPGNDMSNFMERLFLPR